MPFINKHKLRQLQADSTLYQNLITPSHSAFEVIAAERFPGSTDTVFVEDRCFHSDKTIEFIKRLLLLDLLKGEGAELRNRVRAEIVELGGVDPEATPVEALASKLGPIDPAAPIGFIQKIVGPDDEPDTSQEGDKS